MQHDVVRCSISFAMPAMQVCRRLSANAALEHVFFERQGNQDKPSRVEQRPSDLHNASASPEVFW